MKEGQPVNAMMERYNHEPEEESQQVEQFPGSDRYEWEQVTAPVHTEEGVNGQEVRVPTM